MDDARCTETRADPEEAAEERRGEAVVSSTAYLIVYALRGPGAGEPWACPVDPERMLCPGTEHSKQQEKSAAPGPLPPVLEVSGSLGWDPMVGDGEGILLARTQSERVGEATFPTPSCSSLTRMTHGASRLGRSLGPLARTRGRKWTS